MISLLPEHIKHESHALLIYLVKRGADTDKKDSDGKTAVDRLQDVETRKIIIERYFLLHNRYDHTTKGISKKIPSHI